VHVAIDDAQPALGGFFRGEDGAVDDVTHAILLVYSSSSSELQPRKSL
jgi:hypothetical protein